MDFKVLSLLQSSQDTERETETDRQTDRHRERQRDRGRDKDRETESEWMLTSCRPHRVISGRRERERECTNLECSPSVLDEQLLAGAAGEVARPVGTGRDGVRVEVVTLHRPRQIGSVHVMHVTAGGRVQQVHLAARRLLQKDSQFTVHFPRI